MAEAAKAEPLLLQRIRTAERSASRSFRVQFAIIWFLIIVALAVVIYLTGAFELAFVQEWGPFILGGTVLTIVVCVASISFAIVFALIGALGRLSRNPLISAAASFYVSLVRGTPLLVQLFFVFFALPRVGIIIPPVPAGVFALAFNYGAYLTEIFRAGIQAVPRGQREAAQALGMPEGLIMRRIVFPQATRIVVPAIGNEFIAMIKDSSLVSLLGVQELLWRAGTAGRPRGSTFEAFIIAAVIYWILTIVFSFFQERLERRMARGDR